MATATNTTTTDMDAEPDAARGVDAPPTHARSVRAATELMATHERAPDVYEVYNGKGAEPYTVDARMGVCTCGDFVHRADSDERVAEHGCKHIRRVRMERREMDIEPLPGIDGIDVDPLLLEARER